MNIQMIPLNKLILSPANVRKTGGGAGIEELAASIAAHGLLQNLQVRPAAKGKFEVVAGGRRLAALKRLAAGKQIGAKDEIACNVLDGDDAAEISLAENVIRLPMHPADQFEAFHALSTAGKGLEEIAARFGASPAVVRQRLKLASVSPVLIEAYRCDDMTLDQLMAFTISEDHAAQEAAWFGQPEFSRRPDRIRSILTAHQVEASDPRAVFVDLAAYQAAGGGIVRDLFDDQHEGYLTDTALLDRLAVAKLEQEAATVRAEGWKWVETATSLPYEARSRFGWVHPERLPLSDDQQQELHRLAAEWDELADTDGEEPEPGIAERLDRLSDRIDALSEGESVWRAEDLAIAGAIVTVRHDGKAEVMRGLVRPEDRPRLKSGGSDAGGSGAAASKPDMANKDLSARLIEDLTAHRTAALRVELSERPDTALAILVHALALPLFYEATPAPESCLDIRGKSRDLGRSAEGIAESDAGRRLAAGHGSWTAKLPSDEADLLGWLLAQESAELLKLLAYCTALGIDAVRGKQDHPGCARLAAADQLAATLGLDMAQWWQPTKASYFGHVSKAHVLTAVREAVTPQAAENLEGLKKEALAEAAEQRLAGSTWLPPILRAAERVEIESEIDKAA
jgi:ParB family chromosome partitioning protein